MKLDSASRGLIKPAAFAPSNKIQRKTKILMIIVGHVELGVSLKVFGVKVCGVIRANCAVFSTLIAACLIATGQQAGFKPSPKGEGWVRGNQNKEYSEYLKIRDLAANITNKN